MIVIGEVKAPDLGTVRIETSSEPGFIRRYTEINRNLRQKEIATPERLWKIRVVGSGRITAAIQRLIEAAEAPKTSDTQQKGQ